MSSLDQYGSEASPETVSLRYMGECKEGNCEFTVDCGDEATAHRTAGRHEGNNDLTHKVSIEVVIDVDD